jgi:hypothetical protein
VTVYTVYPGTPSPTVPLEVQRAFRLGWRFAQVYHLPPPPDPGAGPAEAPPEHLPGVSELSTYQRSQLLVGQIAHDAEKLAAGTGISAADAKFPAASAKGGDPGTTRQLILDSYLELRTSLGAADAHLGTAIDLGRALADTVLLTSAQLPGTYLEEFKHFRLVNVYGWLDDLHTSFPSHAANAVKGSLKTWEDWVAKTQGIVPDDQGEHATRALRHQGEVWRRLLSGEILPMDMLTAEDYKDAATRMLGRIRSLAINFLKRWWYLIAILLAVIGAITWAVVTYTPRGTAMTAALIATAAGSLGVSWKAVSSTLGKVVSIAENPLWEAEVRQSVIVATTVPPPLPVPHRTMPAFRRAAAHHPPASARP